MMPGPEFRLRERTHDTTHITGPGLALPLRHWQQILHLSGNWYRYYLLVHVVPGITLLREEEGTAGPGWFLRRVDTGYSACVDIGYWDRERLVSDGIALSRLGLLEGGGGLGGSAYSGEGVESRGEEGCVVRGGEGCAAGCGPAETFQKTRSLGGRHVVEIVVVYWIAID